MRRRLVTILTGTALAVVALPAAPAFARTGETCANIPDIFAAQAGETLARTCITWDDDPAGSSYTTTRVKIWNPPNNGSAMVYANVYFNDGTSTHVTGQGDNHTWIGNGKHVGAATTRFQVANEYNETYCMYMAPTTSQVYLGTC